MELPESLIKEFEHLYNMYVPKFGVCLCQEGEVLRQMSILLASVVNESLRGTGAVDSAINWLTRKSQISDRLDFLTNNQFPYSGRILAALKLSCDFASRNIQHGRSVTGV